MQENAVHPLLQVALDVPTRAQALSVARQVAPWTDWLEAGTLLIVNEGLQAVRELRAACPKVTIVADIKIIDGARALAESALDAGANVVTVVSTAYKPMVQAAVTAARARGKQVVGEYYALYFSSPAPFERLRALGVNALGLHLPARTEEGREEAVAAVARALPWLPLPAWLAGDVDVELLKRLRGLPLAGVIVGRAIVQAADPAGEARQVAEALHAWRR